MTAYAYVNMADPQGEPVKTNEPYTAPDGRVFPVLSNVIRAYDQQAGGDDSLRRALLMGIGLYEVDYVFDDQSTGEQYIDDPNYTFSQEADHVVHTYLRRDMTQQELDDSQVERVDALEKSDIGHLHNADMRVMYALAKQIQPTITPAQFETFITNARDDNSVITWARWKTWAKPILNKSIS